MNIRIKDICRFGKKSDIKAGEGNTKGKYMFFTSSIDKDKRIDKFDYDEEGIIMGTGGNATLHYYSGKFAVSTDCLVLLPNSSYKCKYLYYFFLHNMRVLEGGFRGAGLKHTSKSYIENIELTKTHSLLEQDKIISVLSNIDNTIVLQNKRLKLLNELTRSLFIEMFGDPISNPKEWKKKKCKNILTKIGSGATPQGGSESYKEEGISLIRSMNVHNGRFESKDLAYIDEKQAQKLDNVNIKENDVLINITGASVARCCIVPSDVIPARVNQHVSVLRCSDMVNSIFLCYQIINDSYQNLLKKIGTSGGATREAITKKQIEDLEVILPPIELQNKFANFVRGTDKSKLAVKKSLEELEILKKSLMQKYFA
mgnify:CR=1 FL=1